MWPSMVRKKPAATVRSMPVMFNDDAVDGAEGLSLKVDDITDDIARSLFASLDGGIEERELAALEAWLDEDPGTAWRTSASTSTALPALEGSSKTPTQTREADGFEDDFSEFISSAPEAAGPRQISATAAERVQQVYDADALLPLHTDITAASDRIFQQTEDEAASAEDFDLNQVLGVLQAMKEEISLIDDVNKRRDAAAAAALGLVRGLGFGDSGDGDDDDSELGELLTT